MAGQLLKVSLDFPAAGSKRLALAFARPSHVLTAKAFAEVPNLIARAEAHARAGGWAVGCVAYEAAPAFDAALQVRPPAGPWPLAQFALYNEPDASHIGEAAGTFTCGPWQPTVDENAAIAAIETVRRGIAAGDYCQVNLTTRLRSAFAGDPAALFAALRQAQPEGYCAFLDAGPWQLLSVSPELFFDWDADGILTARPMKGTAPRHADGIADAAAAAALRASEKERAENLMIVDLLRNDLARVAVTGSVRVPRLFQLEALPTAWQMTSTVQATTRPGVGLADVFRALFPCGSVTGAPKVAAMAAIARLEGEPRGPYCGAIGLLRPGGHATFSVAIRSVAIDATRGSAECGIGSGITFDSAAADEYAEWMVKRRFLLRASASFQLLETLRLEDGRYWLLPRHLARLGASAVHFGFPCDEAGIRAALDAVAAAHPQGAWRVRLLVDRQGGPRTECFPLETPVAEAAAVLAATPVDEGDEFLRHKTTERAVFDRHRPPEGAWDTLLWNRRGEATEFTRGNLVVELDGRRLTPPLACGLLPGTLRAELLAQGEIAEAVIPVAALARASHLWFINGLRGWVPVRLSAAGELR